MVAYMWIAFTKFFMAKNQEKPQENPISKELEFFDDNVKTKDKDFTRIKKEIIKFTDIKE